ncbi:hypothetical protein, partial [Escherichia coli]|uniref:hypothetical protein n=1 Tax=Escherichia coli TaxID=562 RepID=UPI002928F821
GGAFAVTHHPFISLTGGTAYINISHWSTSKTPSYTKSVSWHHHHLMLYWSKMKRKMPVRQARFILP